MLKEHCLPALHGLLKVEAGVGRVLGLGQRVDLADLLVQILLDALVLVPHVPTRHVEQGLVVVRDLEMVRAVLEQRLQRLLVALDGGHLDGDKPGGWIRQDNLVHVNKCPNQFFKIFFA